MDIKRFITDWLHAANTFDTPDFLKFWHPDAILDDPSVGHIFKGHSAIRNYFEDYFISYNTQTRLVRMEIINEQEVHIEVDFTGEFPGGQIGGIFDFLLKDGKIAFAKADLT